MLEKATRLLWKYDIKEFPVPVDAIEETIFKEDIKLSITKYLKKSFYYEDSKSKIIYLGHKVKATYKQREYLLHETAHMYHNGNTALLTSVVIHKNEGQAQAFAAYFLMPIGVFETYLAKGENDYALSEIFGVTQELVLYRKELSQSLIEGGSYEHMKYIFFN
ncbi:ImmA/IrrE family metallo-endopeptidase [Tepidanaerobacter acetatoxydans]|uniref:ImmA/IrrE family metallo-endopeptidase n=1 Tax=Tepidanaerobacter acetatoxydans TaxID=499229 RepID=UPI001BD2E60E|nr:ImmA/IrrE family metallo-endopeptidase [Tepidanaerobacter acetatoxydans]